MAHYQTAIMLRIECGPILPGAGVFGEEPTDDRVLTFRCARCGHIEIDHPANPGRGAYFAAQHIEREHGVTKEALYRAKPKQRGQMMVWNLLGRDYLTAAKDDKRG